jgi:SAM-dependent methyltransferase
MIRTRWRLGSKRRFVATIEWLRLWPNPGFFPQTEQTFGMRPRSLADVCRLTPRGNGRVDDRCASAHKRPVPTLDLVEFVRSQLPPPPAGVLEIGCGTGDLARVLDAEGYRVVAIDPDAPEGPIFRRTALEEFEHDGRFDAAVSSRSRHHVEPLAAGLDRIASMLEPRGILVLEEFAWDRFDRATATWYADRIGEPVQKVLEDWRAEHVGLHGYEAMRRELDRRFEQRGFEWMPYLHRYPETQMDEEDERKLIADGAVSALGFRYTGAATVSTRG